jgi:hypothetical protein
MKYNNLEIKSRINGRGTARGAKEGRKVPGR